MATMDWEAVRAAIMRANKLGKDGKRVIGALYQYTETATTNDVIVLTTDDGPESASECW